VPGDSVFWWTARLGATPAPRPQGPDVRPAPQGHGHQTGDPRHANRNVKVSNVVLVLMATVLPSPE
jgi:hypothetical protein